MHGEREIRPGVSELSHSATQGRRPDPLAHVLEGNTALWEGRRAGWTSAAYLGRALSKGEAGKSQLTFLREREKTGDLEECVRKRGKLGHVLKSKLEEAVFSKCMWAVDVANFLWVKSVIQR